MPPITALRASKSNPNLGGLSEQVKNVPPPLSPGEENVSIEDENHSLDKNLYKYDRFNDLYI